MTSSVSGESGEISVLDFDFIEVKETVYNKFFS